MRLAFLISVLISAVSVSALEDQPSIISVQVSFVDPGYPDGLLFVSGTGFGATTPVVTLGEFALAVLTSTETDITAELPPSLAPATYLLVVTNAHPSAKSDSADVTIGTHGPPGSEGPTRAHWTHRTTRPTGTPRATRTSKSRDALGP